jgi:hypothetical protein
MAAASRETGIAYATVKAKERGLRNNSGDEYKRMLALESGAPGSEDRLVPFSGDELCGEARRALEDFGFFRYRYFGRRSTPWQEEAGHQVVAWLATKQKEYAVVNCPPGSGKTTLFTHDIPAWLTCRNRGIRGALGHASQQIAEAYLRQLKLTFENPVPIRAEPDEFELGLAVDAEATLVGDFGPVQAEAVGVVVESADHRGPDGWAELDAQGADVVGVRVGDDVHRGAAGYQRCGMTLRTRRVFGRWSRSMFAGPGGTRSPRSGWSRAGR